MTPPPRPLAGARFAEPRYVGPRVPRRGNRFTRWLGGTVLAAMGWRLGGSLPDEPKLVAVGAPHTSNWDFVLVVAAAFRLGVEIHWLGKHTLFRPPLGPLMRWLGGIPVDRTTSSGVVTQSADRFRDAQRLLLCIAPEGTRSRVRRWKSGFYHIAREAGVPVLLCSLDYRRRIVGLGPLVWPRAEPARELARVRAYYRPFRGRRTRPAPAAAAPS